MTSRRKRLLRGATDSFAGERSRAPVPADLPVTHTAGPWTVVRAEDGVEWDITAGGWYVATVRDLARDDGQEERNAKLMAAAPDLLEAVRVMLNAHPGCNCDRCTKAVAALRKAGV